MIDRNGRVLQQNDPVTFYSLHRGKTMSGVVISDRPMGKMVEVKIANDPFTSWVEHEKLQSLNTKQSKLKEKREHKMPTATAKELRKQAKAAGIDGWEDMDRDELVEALADSGDEDEAPARPAKKAAKSAKAGKRPTKKAAATKKAAKPTKATAKRAASEDEDEEEGDNPFRSGSNLWHMTEALMKGGKRSAMVTKLKNKIDLNPRVRGGRNYDVDAELDYRLVRVCQVLTNDHGFVIEKDGRGPDQTVKAIPPSEQ